MPVPYICSANRNHGITTPSGDCIQFKTKGVVFYEDGPCMEGSRFLTLRNNIWRNVNETSNHHP